MFLHYRQRTPTVLRVCVPLRRRYNARYDPNARRREDMTVSDTHKKLREAYQLAQQDRIEEAQRILRPILDAEPNNVQAWWILAHAVETPTEARAALEKVLELDPNFDKADKARDMLRQINEQFPEAVEEDTAFSAYTDDMDDLFGGAADTDAADVFADDALDQYGIIDDSFFSEEEDLAEFEAVLDSDAFEMDEEAEAGTDFLAELSEFEEEAPETPKTGDEQALRDFLGTPETLPEFDEDTLAAREERAGRKRGSTILALLGVVVLAAVIAGAAVWAWLNFFGGTEAKDPGALTALETSSLQETSAVSSAKQALDRAGLGQARQAFIAETSLGRTLFVEFCREPSPTLADDINRAMRIVLEQAPAVEGVVDAVGVSINRCQAPQHDTLFRAVVTLPDALRYRDEVSAQDEIGWAEFQQYWHTS